MTPLLLDPTTFPAQLEVRACWALINNGPNAIPRFTLHRYTNLESEAQSWPIDHRADAERHVDPMALMVQRARGDDVQLLDAWISVDGPMRELLLSDPAFHLRASAPGELPPV